MQKVKNLFCENRGRKLAVLLRAGCENHLINAGGDILARGHKAPGVFWRVAVDEINYRRFFDINELAGLRMEHAEVFEATHALLLDLNMPDPGGIAVMEVLSQELPGIRKKLPVYV